MASSTPNLSLRRPAAADLVDVVADIADNMTAIDTAVAARLTTAAHAATDHEAVTGVLSATEHTAIDHSGLASVMSPTEHTAADHAGLTGVPASTLTANTQTDSYTLVLGDASKVVEMNKATANALTVPPNSSVAFPVGTIIEVHQYGAGQTTLTPGAGVTIRSSGAKLKLTAQYSTAALRKRATDEWVAAGDLSA